MTKKNKISATERIFSLSSTTSPANKNLEEELSKFSIRKLSLTLSRSKYRWYKW